MKKTTTLGFVLFFLTYFPASAQDQHNLVWWDPAASGKAQFEGQAWAGERDNAYSRLPSRAAASVRNDVYELGQQSAGVFIPFETNAVLIKVEYAVTGALQFPHMSATGVSGVNLYCRKTLKDWFRATGQYSFGDTIRYSFLLQEKGSLPQPFHFKLYLPLYNHVKWLRIGIDSGATIKEEPLRKEKPVVVYGTSIAQGACATRPGMAWTAILERTLNTPVLNFGFSGNGRLEPAVIDLLNEINAAAFVLDCLPNLTGTPHEELKQKIIAAVKQIHEKHPNTSILLVEHPGFGDEEMNEDHKQQCLQANAALNDAAAALVRSGVKKVTVLHKNEIGLSEDCYVDQMHPNDLGMTRYANAYARKLKPLK